MMKVMSFNFEFLKNLIILDLWSIFKNNICNTIGDSGCKEIFKNSKHLTNLKKQYVWSKLDWRNENGLTDVSTSAIINYANCFQILMLLKIQGTLENRKFFFQW